MISKQSRLIFSVLKAMDFKNTLQFEKPSRKKIDPGQFFPQNKYKTSKKMIRGHLVFTIKPVIEDLSMHVIFFHGGAYVFEATRMHFQLIKKMVDKMGCTLSYVDYPLAPEHVAEETLQMVRDTYFDLVDEDPNATFALMGDSAGGGLALSLSMMIRDQGGRRPEKIVLFSPWLDLGFTHPDIENLTEKDVILVPETLRKIGKQYAGNLDLCDYGVSPKYGDLNGLGEIAVFYGTDEILFPDCLELAKSSIGYEYKGMQHDWVMFPIPERSQVIDDVYTFLKK